jgi:hypothetical protein
MPSGHSGHSAEMAGAISTAPSRLSNNDSNWWRGIAEDHWEVEVLKSGPRKVEKSMSKDV